MPIAPNSSPRFYGKTILSQTFLPVPIHIPPGYFPLTIMGKQKDLVQDFCPMEEIPFTRAICLSMDPTPMHTAYKPCKRRESHGIECMSCP